MTEQTHTDPELAGLELRLTESAALRARLLDTFGFMPMSVLDVRRGKNWQSIFHYQGELGKSTGKGKRADKKGGVFHSNRALRISGGGSRSKTGQAWSIMAPELVEFFAKYYSEPGKVYLDPFAGQGVQMQVARSLGMHYLGYDLCKEFCDYMWATQQKINATVVKTGAEQNAERDYIASELQRVNDTQGEPPVSYVAFRDSKHPTTIPDRIGDFGFTSPPYWDIEYYGDEDEQLGIGKTYDEFMDGLTDVWRSWLAKFKPGAKFIVNVNDFRKDGELYTYHADCITSLQDAGWRITDIAILPFIVGSLPKVFAAAFNAKKILPKVHEYAIVCTKP